MIIKAFKTEYVVKFTYGYGENTESFEVRFNEEKYALDFYKSILNGNIAYCEMYKIEEIAKTSKLSSGWDKGITINHKNLSLK